MTVLPLEKRCFWHEERCFGQLRQRQAAHGYHKITQRQAAHGYHKITQRQAAHGYHKNHRKCRLFTSSFDLLWPVLRYSKRFLPKSLLYNAFLRVVLLYFGHASHNVIMGLIVEESSFSVVEPSFAVEESSFLLKNLHFLLAFGEQAKTGDLVLKMMNFSFKK